MDPEQQELERLARVTRGGLITPAKRVAEKRSVPPSPFDLNLHLVFTAAEVFEEKYRNIMEDSSEDLDR